MSEKEFQKILGHQVPFPVVVELNKRNLAAYKSRLIAKLEGMKVSPKYPHGKEEGVTLIGLGYNQAINHIIALVEEESE